MPAHFLHEPTSIGIRRKLLQHFQLLEVGLLPDNIFTYSSSECALILAKRLSKEEVSSDFLYGRVREDSVERFKNDYEYESSEVVAQGDILNLPDSLLRLH